MISKIDQSIAGREAAIRLVLSSEDVNFDAEVKAAIDTILKQHGDDLNESKHLIEKFHESLEANSGDEALWWAILMPTIDPEEAQVIQKHGHCAIAEKALKELELEEAFVAKVPDPFSPGERVKMKDIVKVFVD